MQPDESYAKAGSLWQNQDYLYLTTGETVSTLGGGVASFALPLVILTLTRIFHRLAVERWCGAVVCVDCGMGV